MGPGAQLVVNQHDVSTRRPVGGKAGIEFRLHDRQDVAEPCRGRRRLEALDW
mgnify:CR=1 FL=1